MEVVLTPAQMRAYDAHAMRSWDVEDAVLMENAGAALAREVASRFGAGRDAVWVLAGKGNNGGDGMVAARHLASAGFAVHLSLIGSRASLKGEPRRNYGTLARLSKILPNLSLSVGLAATREQGAAAVIIDALLGTGTKGAPAGLVRKAIDRINGSSAFVVAADVPSGLDAELGVASGSAVRADLTVTMAFRKTGMLVNDGPDCCGDIVVASLGVPQTLPKSIEVENVLVDGDFVRSVLPQRSRRAHKYSFQKTLVIAGSRGLTGAPVMTCKSLLRVGGGLVRLVCPESSAHMVLGSLPEAMISPVAETADGSISAAALRDILNAAGWADMLVIGPGISRNPETASVVRQILERIDKPTVLDADGLNAVDKRFLRNLKRKTALTLTPHLAEASRVTGVASSEIEQRRAMFPAHFSGYTRSIVVLKGAPTVTAAPDGRTWFNSSGNPALATPGSGDILTGIIGGLMAQYVKPEFAAVAGVYLHGLAADRIAARSGERGLLATDLIDELPGTISHLVGVHGNR